VKPAPGAAPGVVGGVLRGKLEIVVLERFEHREAGRAGYYGLGASLAGRQFRFEPRLQKISIVQCLSCCLTTE
jgi:hypothetical protein